MKRIHAFGASTRRHVVFETRRHAILKTRRLAHAGGALILALVLAGGWLCAPVVAAASERAEGANKQKPSSPKNSTKTARATVAIVDFDYSGRNEDLAPLGPAFAQMLITDMASVGQIQVVERAKLQSILAEHKLSRSGNIDARTAAKAGKLLGARFLILGQFFDFAQKARFDARLVSVETGKVITSVGQHGSLDELWDVESRLAEDLRSAIADAAPELAETVKTAEATKAAKGSGSKDAPAKQKTHRPRERRHVKKDTVVRYGKALEAIDSGNKDEAREHLNVIKKEAPEFIFAAGDLSNLLQ